MNQSMKTVRIVLSPFQPSMETAFGVVLAAVPPYSDRGVTLLLNPAGDDYHEELPSLPGVRVRQATHLGVTDETQQLQFDLGGTSTLCVKIGDREIEIRLVNVGKVNQAGQDFRYYDFIVSAVPC